METCPPTNALPQLQTRTLDPALESPHPAHALPAAAHPSWTGLAPHRLKHVLSCIELRLAERVQVGELAREVHMSPFHFTRMFKLATGHSPHRYLTLQRVELAKQLLVTSQLPIAAIAVAVGYQTQAHFTGVFARHAGATPKVYRVTRRHREPGGARPPLQTAQAAH
jgi:transcriptional regulator GlxA family with amidase domain